MSKKYESPPLIEAICEFRFTPGQEWDATFPGLIYEKVKDDFNKKKTVRQIRFQPIRNQDEQIIEQEITERIQFVREDGRALIQVAPNFLTVNCLSPYPGWNQFHTMISENLNKYTYVAEPEGLRRIGLRYINRIEIPITRVNLEDYFDFYPHLGDKLPQEHGPFIVGVQIFFEDKRDVLKLDLTTAKSSNSEGLPLFLSLDYFCSQSNGIGLKEIDDWIETAHTHIEDTFEACITEKTRSLFEEVQ